MQEFEEIKLPASGLAEDILAQFANGAAQKQDFSVAQREQTEGAATCHLVGFRLAREEYGLEIGNVREIIRATDISHVPGAPRYVKGVINLRGKIIPVVDLRKRFSLPEIAGNDDRRIVVVELRGKRLGILVDSVSRVIRLSALVIEEVPEEVTTASDNYIKGVGKMDCGMIIILDLERLLFFHN